VKYSDYQYGIEVAVAGFTKDEISVEVDQDQLTIRGIKDRPEEAEVEYLHRGLAARDFEQVFTLAEYMEIRGAEVKDGMLKIAIERIIPDALLPRKIEVKG
jgi:molecular chaperone IbpA